MVATRPRIYKRPESVLVVVYTRNGKVLLMRRADHPEFWQSVTGSMEWSESLPRETACRELKEELGWYEVAALQDLDWTQEYEILPRWRHRYGPGVLRNTEHAFALAIPDSAPLRLNPEEHRELAWLDVDQALARVTSWSNRNVIEFLANTVLP